MKNKKIILGVLITLLMVSISGITFAIFSYSQIGGNNQLITGDIYMHYRESNTLTIENALPTNTYDSSKYFEFTITGKNTNTLYDITYDIVLSRGDVPTGKQESNRLQDQYIKFRLTEFVENESTHELEESEIFTNQSYPDLLSTARVHVDTVDKNTTSEITRTYRLYMWISNDIVIGNTAGAIPMNDWNSIFASVKVNVTGDFANKVAHKIGGADVIKAAQGRAADGSNCLTTVTDGETTYISGTKDCINFNYVWWSGKMWRIVAVYSDGSMKMVTDNNITSISFGSNTTYYDKTNSAKSWIFEWLNEDFKSTLYNQGSGVIDTTKSWNATMPGSSAISTKPAETDATMIPTTTSPIGLLNSYEYYKSYQNTTYANGYLNIGYTWWLLNPYDASHVYYVNQTGNGEEHTQVYAYGVRPAVYLDASVALSGNGTKTSPYKLSTDYSDASPSSLLNTRHSGEYIKFSGDASSAKYRIVSVEDNKTKIVAMDYTDNKAVKRFASTVNFGDNGNTQSNDYWDYYLNNDWYNGLSFKTNIVSSTFYIGTVGSNMGYKVAICQSASNITSDCLTDSTKRVTESFTGNVGLLRFGEMFATQQWTGYNDSRSIFLITKLDASTIRVIDYIGHTRGSSLSGVLSVRPSMYLNSSVSILSGSGTELDPYVVG